MSEPALCQCTRCFRYLAQDRRPGGVQVCTGCDQGYDGTSGGIPLAKIRGTLSYSPSLELMALTSEECSEVIQRIGKIIRWGWDADFHGTTQQAKLESELGDVLAAVALLVRNGEINIYNVYDAYRVKIDKFTEDAEGPRQRLLHAKVPKVEELVLALSDAHLKQGAL